MKRFLSIMVLALVVLWVQGCVVICVEDTDPCEPATATKACVTVGHSGAVGERTFGPACEYDRPSL